MLETLRQRHDAPFRMFLHDITELPIEMELIQRASQVYAGNEELAQRISSSGAAVETLWSPATILDYRQLEPVDISLFSFGMAHKMHTDIYRRLHELLEDTGKSYSLYVSNANHESARLEDARLIYEEMHTVFPRGLYFLGHLSDIAVSTLIAGTTYFAAFFPRGARANNSTVVAAMERGATVLTNLDQQSPDYLRHMHTVIDVMRCDELPTDPALRLRIGAAARDAAGQLSWDHLAHRLL